MISDCFPEKTNSTGSSMVTILGWWLWLIASTRHAIVVVFPDPVGPEIRIRPSWSDVTSFIVWLVRPTSLAAGGESGRGRNDANNSPSARAMLTRKRLE